MKKIVILTAALMLGFLASQVSAQQGSYLVQPRAKMTRVQVAVPYVGVQIQTRYVAVQPRPYLVTPIITPRPPKPAFRTPLRNEIWRKLNRRRVRYVVTPQ